MSRNQSPVKPLIPQQEDIVNIEAVPVVQNSGFTKLSFQVVDTSDIELGVFSDYDLKSMLANGIQPSDIHTSLNTRSELDSVAENAGDFILSNIPEQSSENN